jgi:hypothetical protein
MTDILLIRYRAVLLFSGTAFLWIVQGLLPRQRKTSSPRLELGKVRNILINAVYCTLPIVIVPVIVAFTKFDAMDDEAYGALKEEGLLQDDAVNQAPSRAMKDFEKARKDLSIFKSRYPPKAFVILRGKAFSVIVYGK